MRLSRLLLPCLAWFLLVSSAQAAELLPPTTAIHTAIDHYIDQGLTDLSVTPAALADDATLLRRITLDLAGRIPTAAEYQSYLSDTSADKKTKLIDKLLASPAYVRHQATEFDTMLAPDNGGRKSGNLREYLGKAFKEERPWDRIFRELMLPDEADPARKGSSQFLKSRVKDLDRLTTDVSVLFFGVNISCAQCHDHPLVHDWKQDHYYGLKAFFTPTFEAGQFLGEREPAVVQFKTTKNVAKSVPLMFLTGKVVETPNTKLSPEEMKKLAEAKKKPAKGDGKQPDAPKFSSRSALVELALKPDQRDFFAKAIVNRLWYRHFAQGLVSPIDQMHSENNPSHPELLSWLGRDMAENGYNIKRLIRGIVMSKTYARSSRYDNDKTPVSKAFAVAKLRALTPMQLATSLKIATLDPKQFPDTLKADELERKIETVENSAKGIAAKIEYPREDFQISVTESLLFSNNESIQRELLGEDSSRLLARLKETKTPEEAVDLATKTVLTRAITAEERKVMSDYLAARKDRIADAHKQMLWALLTSAEFRFNY